jgi:hypothetical protein
MSIEQQVAEKLHRLPPAIQQEVLDFVEALECKHRGNKRHRRKLVGAAADLRVDLTEQDIAEARREMWGNFPRDDI